MKQLLFTWLMLIVGQKAMGQGQAYKSERPESIVYRSLNGRPDENLTKVIEMMGGIENLIGSNDVVLIKPNVQWWNQGAPNLLALKTFVDMVMARPGGFNGEVVIAENCHRGKTPWTSLGSGWAHAFHLNSDLPGITNMNDLCEALRKKYGLSFTTTHWIDVAKGAKRVYHPSDVPGYVYCDGTKGVPLLEYDNGVSGDKYRATIMTYPIFITDKGTVVDFKNGIWKGGRYTDQPLRYINFAALNHHSDYCGATSSIKNYLGVSDISGGADPFEGGRLTDKYYNFHSFPYDKWKPGPKPGMLGGEIALFMKAVRGADLNITTAEWIGLSSRTDAPVAHTRTVLASADPVALDYHATKYVLYPNSAVRVHNPDNKNSPLYEYLLRCSAEGGGLFDEKNVGIKSYDFKRKALQQDNDLQVAGDITWGSDPKAILKYLVFRYWI